MFLFLFIFNQQNWQNAVWTTSVCICSKKYVSVFFFPKSHQGWCYLDAILTKSIHSEPQIISCFFKENDSSYTYSNCICLLFNFPSLRALRQWSRNQMFLQGKWQNFIGQQLKRWHLMGIKKKEKSIKKGPFRKCSLNGWNVSGRYKGNNFDGQVRRWRMNDEWTLVHRKQQYKLFSIQSIS